MSYTDFLTLMLNYQKFIRNLSALEKVGVDLFESPHEVSSQVYNILRQAFLNTYTEDGWGWIDWFIHENEWGAKDWSKYQSEEVDTHPYYPAMDSEGNPVAYSYDSLYTLLEKQYKR